MEEALSGRIGRYALLGRVGRGGMGEVHRARAFGAAGVTKELCIKRIRCERLADPVALGRFVAEARVSMRLSHANIVSVFDFGRSENDYYLAMEWVDGCDLRRLLARREGAIEQDLALFIAAEVARGLSYLHGLDGQERLAHCDLKPANVLVSRSGEVKLADFGVAVPGDTLAAGGTRRYMAPEQRSGSAVGPSVDLYALGLLLDEMLGGNAAREPDAPSYVAPTALAAPLRTLLERLCARDPSARPASAAEVADELEALLAEARVRTKRSPREMLVREIAGLTGPEAADEPPEDFRTDASYVTEGESETFARRMRPDASPRSESRSTPVPPRPPPARWVSRLLAVLAIPLTLALVLQLTHVDPSVPPPSTPPPPTSAPRTQARTAAPLLPPPIIETTVGVPPPATTTTERAPRRAVAPQVEAIEAPVEPAPSLEPAVVRLNARPWAEVTIDGTVHGVTPLVNVSLAPGPHDIVFTNPALGITRTEHLALGPGEHRDVIVDLR